MFTTYTEYTGSGKWKPFLLLDVNTVCIRLVLVVNFYIENNRSRKIRNLQPLDVTINNVTCLVPAITICISDMQNVWF